MIAFAYDALGRLCRRVTAVPGVVLQNLAAPCTTTATGATTDTRYTRDAAGNALTITDAIAARTITSTYDQLNRPLTVSADADATSTTYTYDFSTPTRADPSATYTATLDLYGRQTSMTDGLHTSGNIYRWTYAPSGAVATSADPTGNVTTNTYDPLGRLTARSTTGASGCTTCAVYAFAYNRAGNQVTKTSTISGDTTNGTTTYAYDALSRLTTYTPPVAISSGAYTWNAQPDRASIQIGTGTPVTTTFDLASRPVSDSAGNTYVSNKEGRILAMPGKTLVWDNLGRLTQANAAPSGTLLATYTYDALDRLRTIAENATTIRFRYVGLTTTVAQVINDSPATLVSGHATDFAGTELFDFTSGGATQTYLGRNDHGDVTWTSGTTGAVNARAAYDPFGTLVASSGTIPPTRWQGSWQDTVTGLYYVIARWYAPSSGRFLSDDPLAGDTTRPQTRDPYAYVAGNPLGGTDPMGTCVWDTVTNTCKDADAPASGYRGDQIYYRLPQPRIGSSMLKVSFGGKTFRVDTRKMANAYMPTMHEYLKRGAGFTETQIATLGPLAAGFLYQHRNDGTTWLNYGIYTIAKAFLWKNYRVSLNDNDYLRGKTWAEYAPKVQGHEELNDPKAWARAANDFNNEADRVNAKVNPLGDPWSVAETVVGGGGLGLFACVLPGVDVACVVTVVGSVVLAVPIHAVFLSLRAWNDGWYNGLAPLWDALERQSRNTHTVWECRSSYCTPASWNRTSNGGKWVS